MSDDIAGNLESLLGKVFKEACEAIDEKTHEVYLVSTENFCPYLTGELKGSATEETITNTDEEHTNEIAYNADHAKIVHEVNIPHYNPANAQWKYLEVPLGMYEDKILESVKTAVRNNIDG